MLFKCRQIPSILALLSIAVIIVIYRTKPLEKPLNTGSALSTPGFPEDYSVRSTQGIKSEDVWYTDLRVGDGTSSDLLWFDMSEADRSSNDEHGMAEANFTINGTITNLEKIEPRARCASIAAVANLMINTEVENGNSSECITMNPFTSM